MVPSGIAMRMAVMVARMASSGPASQDNSPPTGRLPCLLVEPDDGEVLVEVVAGRDLPPLHVRAVWNNTVPPQRDVIVGLVVDHPLLVGTHDLALLGLVGGPVHGVVELEQLCVLELAVLVAGGGQELRRVGQRIDDRLAVE